MTVNERSATHQGNPDRSRKGFHLFLCLNLFLSILSLAIPSFEAEAATITVDTFVDDLTDNGNCSLREAIQAANTNTSVDACTAGNFGTDIITLPAGTYVLSIVGNGEDDNETGDLDITDYLIINGDSMTTTIIEGDMDWDDRIMDFQIDRDLTLSDLTILYGSVDGDGGGLRFLGDQLNIDRIRVNDNEATGNGGGIYIDGVSPSYIDDLYIHGNSCTGSGCDGGGIYVLSPLHINTSDIYENSALHAGGGLAQDAGVSLIIRDSRFHDNQADLGGGIYARGLRIDDSEISNNTATLTSSGMGGGIYFDGAATGQIYDTTISGNQANSSGGGLWLGGIMHVLLGNVTITDNEANADSSGSDYGGGIYSALSAQPLHVANTIIAENILAGVVSADHADCTNDGGTLDTQGWNLQGLQSSSLNCDFNDVNDMQGTVASPLDPLLGPLADNGGPTYTHALISGSPALEMGNPAAPGGTWPVCSYQDQRGISRPQHISCDIGAFELEENNPPYTPSNPIPVDSAVDVTINTVLSWDGGDPDGHPVTYDVYFEADNPSPSVLLCDDTSDTTCDPGTMTESTTYYWYVEAYDGVDTTTGPVWSFTTGIPAELLVNTDLEIVVPSPWKGDNLETVDGSDCGTAHGGLCSAALTGSSGPTKMLFYGLPGFSGSAGDTFNLSYYNRRQDVGGAGAVQVRMSIQYTDATMGHFSYVPGVGTADWALYSHDFTAAKNYDWGVVRLIFSKPNGTLWYDDMSLMRNGTDELLNNNDMEISVPSGWKGANLSLVDGSDCTEWHSGTCSALLTGTTGSSRMLFYGIPGFSGSAGDVFTLSYWNMRDMVNGAGALQVRVSIRYTDMTMGHFSYVPGVGTSDWEYFVHELTAAKDYDWGVVRLIFGKPNGFLYYDEISLIR